MRELLKQSKNQTGRAGKQPVLLWFYYTIRWRCIPSPFWQDRPKRLPIWQEYFCLFLAEFMPISKIANLLILATRHLGWQQVATKWQQTQKSTGFGFNFSRHKKAENP